MPDGDGVVKERHGYEKPRFMKCEASKRLVLSRGLHPVAARHVIRNGIIRAVSLGASSISIERPEKLDGISWKDIAPPS